MAVNSDTTLTLAYMNIRGQTGLDVSKQLQIEHFLKSYKVDILNCQEINISEDSFSQCDFITSSYDIITNNAHNKYGTCCIVSNDFKTENVKLDTSGRVIAFNIENITFCNVYLPSGSDPVMKNSRENYAAEIIPQILINCKEFGCIGGDWNSIIENSDATKNSSNKQSKSLKRLVRNFSWIDSFKQLHPHSQQFSRYYDNSAQGEGASRIDRMYHYGQLLILEAYYVGVAFSDHLTLIVRIKLPENMSKLVSPKSKPLFKSKPNVIQDDIFQSRLKLNFELWLEVRKSTNIDVLNWWELVVKPNIKKLLIARGREINKERNGELNLLLIRQSYLVRKLQLGRSHFLADLKLVQAEIVKWHNVECEKVKFQSRSEELNSAENVRIYHHELHKKHIRRTSILKLETANGVLAGHEECSSYLENSVGQLLLHPVVLDPLAQQELLRDVQPVFTVEDNKMMTKLPSKDDVKLSVSTSNLHAAPGTDGLSSFLYHHCWEILGDALTEVVQAIHGGEAPTHSQRTSLMVFGSKPKKPHSTKPGDKRKISLLNSDFKITTGITNARFKKVATHTLSPCQLAAGDDRRIHHGINSARDAILAAGHGKEGVGILDNDYQAAFDFMVLLWVLEVLRAKGLAEEVIHHLVNLYSNNITIVVVNNILGRKYENKRWSIRQGDRPSSILFCYGIDPHLDWLDKRLHGIPIYRMPAAGPVLEKEPFPLSVSEVFRLIGYIDDVKPAITSMAEFSLVDHGSAIFEAASGCILHRDPESGKVKFLPLGRWKGSLSKEDLPVNYVAISEHLDMIGVELRATHTQTRKANGDNLQDRVKNTIGPWKGGKFMPLTQRCHSVNTYCLSKMWFKCASVDLRILDIQKITSNIKSWVYADLLEKPDEIVLYRGRNEGGLNLVNIKYRAMAELIKSFLDTSINPTFRRNIYHRALYDWHVENIRTIPNPGRPPYYSLEFFEAIRSVKDEGLLRISTMSSGMWYRVLLEDNVTSETDQNGFRYTKACKTESKHPDIDWEQTWPLACIPGLESADCSFLWRMVHNLLPTQERLNRILNSVNSPLCTLCNQQVVCDLPHALITCHFNNDIGNWLIRCLGLLHPHLNPQQLVILHFDLDAKDRASLSTVWLTAKTLEAIWQCRITKKASTIFATRATLEANIMLLRKTRFADCAEALENLIVTN